MDEYGRLIPAVNRFPSAADKKGFKPIADYIHSKGLKFGIHIMRGIPRQAVAANTKVKGTEYTARQIAHPSSICSWNTDMYGLDSTKPGAQEYYNSIIITTFFCCQVLLDFIFANISSLLFLSI